MLERVVAAGGDHVEGRRRATQSAEIQCITGLSDMLQQTFRFLCPRTWLLRKKDMHYLPICRWESQVHPLSTLS